jgi:lipopolysaccharide/colanic/teichoic acid biosynthesis glycosyltransferase
MIKRAFDCTAALAGIILLLPVFVVVAVLIRLDSPGPVLFRHQRVGRGFRPLFVYKFRTMVDGGGGGKITFRGNADSRITRVGRMLRAVKIDELPQLMNVLKGEMSLVGPRPEVAEYVDLFHEDFETILTVRPGMTDFASLEYCDEAALLEQAADPVDEYTHHILPAKIMLEREYLRRASLPVDIALIVRTVLSVFKGSRHTRRLASRSGAHES